jgi:hypothetical protein
MRFNEFVHRLNHGVILYAGRARGIRWIT